VSFLNVVEIESALAGLAAQYPAQATLLTLPFPTAEGRTSHALRIGTANHCPSVGVLIVSGMHARERGGPDTCVYFAADLLEAHSLGAGLTYGGTAFTAQQVRSIVERMHVVVFPSVNPDGIHYAQTVNVWWRKNRNPANGPGDRTGVDVNRNFNFLWDLGAFTPTARANQTLGSDDPASYQYHGTSPFSEAETSNVRWLFEQHPNIVRFVDIHSYGGDILYPWGDDDNQWANLDMNFNNSGWNGQRGDHGSGYGEYINKCDRDHHILIGQQMGGAIAGVRGETYPVDQAFMLPSYGTPYPASGTSTDWAYVRHLHFVSDRKVFAFGIEFNRNKADQFFVTWENMQPIIRDVDAGLVRLCLTAAPRFVLDPIFCSPLTWARDNILHRILPPQLRRPYGTWGRIRHVGGTILYALAKPFRR
jgi:murein tripeptide amidase MpaA